ncbi:hypothetical protein [Saccharicrinis sp. FJH54]|uniref:hypothetical protein n=1 Tax=Saccharicrinis sp. FJH54 TaxID=3344665 RepID=UPI0035D4D277
MKFSKLNQTRLFYWLAWIILLLALIGLYYHSYQSKNIHYEIIESILIIGFTIIIFSLGDSIFRLHLLTGTLKVYGDKTRQKPIFWFFIGLGIVSILLGFAEIKDLNLLVFRLTLGVIWIISAIMNTMEYYILKTEKHITKLGYDSLKIRDVKTINFLIDKIELETSKSYMNIYYARLKDGEKTMIINELEKIKIKNNLA